MVGFGLWYLTINFKKLYIEFLFFIIVFLTLHWLNLEDTYLRGNSLKDALDNSGIGFGALGIIDYWEKTKELPMEYKLLVWTNTRLFVKLINKIYPFEDSTDDEVSRYKCYLKEDKQHLEKCLDSVYNVIINNQFNSFYSSTYIESKKGCFYVKNQWNPDIKEWYTSKIINKIKRG